MRLLTPCVVLQTNPYTHSKGLWALISWGTSWKQSYAFSALQTILGSIQVSMEDQRPRGLQAWRLLFKRLSNTQSFIPQMFHAWDSDNLIASLNSKCGSSRVEWIVSVSSIASQLSSHTTVVCGQYFSPSGHQGKKVWLIAVGKNNDPETPCPEGPELIVRFYSQETEQISSLLIVLCFQKVMGLLPGALLLEFSSVLAELFLPLPMITVLASRTP